MAKRFGGKFSPGGATDAPRAAPTTAAATPRRGRAGARSALLFFLPLPLIWQAFGAGATQLALNLFALALMLLAAWLTREGLLAQEAYEARKVARRPAFPRKMAGSVVTGGGLAVAAFAGTGGLISPLIIGGVGAALHFGAFGPDPLSDKGMEGIDSFQQDRAARAIDEAEKHLTAMSDAIARARDRKLSDRVSQFQTTVRTMFRTIEEDPRDLTSARKYLSVYLQGARDATIKFADIYSRSQDAQARMDYEALLTDLETNFAAQTEKMLGDDRTDLDIEIEVLRDRLAREGVQTNKA